MLLTIPESPVYLATSTFKLPRTETHYVSHMQVPNKIVFPLCDIIREIPFN